ncbi:MAG: ATP-dependent RecD-like DNA helicase [Ignavibacteriaceae bacterium]|nr:ATP-dependent RecD-like DNA helicase [Ignavibacteriaceae bacterium]
MAILKGKIEKITFYNETNGYTVLKLHEGSVVTGNLPKLNPGETIQFEGDWIFHEKFGKQLKCLSYSIVQPTGKEAVLKYLESGIIEGITKSVAMRIVDMFGEKSLEVLDKNLNVLEGIPKIKKEQIEKIKVSWEEQRTKRKFVLFLQQFDIPVYLANKIFGKYGDMAEFRVSENPYQLIWDVKGIGFKTADKIAFKLGFQEDFPERIKTGILYALESASNEGHIYLPFEELKKYCRKEVKFEIEEYLDHFNSLKENGHIIQIEDRIYLGELYYSERNIEKLLIQRIEYKAGKTEKIKVKSSKSNTLFSEKQLEAINLSTKSKILILTGGPGTGKTTTVQGIIQLFSGSKKKIALAAPTGRAAKRLTELTGKTAKTIHRLLEYDPSYNIFLINEDNQLEIDLLVIDEVSMVNQHLFESVLLGLPLNCTLILVGDKDQLPAIGPGNILNDLISSGKIPVIRLTEIFRQAQQSQIIMNSHRINCGEVPEISNSPDNDFFFIEVENASEIPPLIIDLLKRRLPAKYNFDPVSDIQIITPMYRGSSGVDELNREIQSQINTEDIIYSKNNRIYKKGDKVMQLANDYEKDIYNGDIGIAESYDNKNERLTVTFGSKNLTFTSSEMDNITLAYAATVHKSQGSEYPCVIMPVTSEHFIMLKRNLIYTAVTRAKKLLILIGTKNMLYRGIEQVDSSKRYTSLFLEDLNGKLVEN